MDGRSKKPEVEELFKKALALADADGLSEMAIREALGAYRAACDILVSEAQRVLADELTEWLAVGVDCWRRGVEEMAEAAQARKGE
ncbi:MAG TPA: hypothetical protein VMY35_12230 [Phycisphaerae bacterium]|nr:hypothetical protein [Phycisphaerae bacterium]